LLPIQYVEELLSLAHVQAIAGRAGVSLFCPDRDFGVDGTFRRLTVLENRRFPSGFALDFQLKASTQCQFEANSIVYDLEVKTYNDLINRRLGGDAIPCILILKILPTDSSKWLDISETGLFLQGGCYWDYLQGTPSSNQKTVRIRIPKTQLFTPDILLQMLNRIATGEWPYGYD
jgi:hypothetical protein